MDGEKMTLPEGWIVEEPGQEEVTQPEEAVQPKKGLPKGWVVEEEPKATPKERDLQKFQESIGMFEVRDLSPAEIKNLSFDELIKYRDEVNLAGRAFTDKEFGKGVLSGLTFGASENINALKPVEFEEESNISSGSGKIAGSFLPISKMVNIVKGPAMKLAAKSPIFQEQIGSLITMMGVGTATGALETLAKGEMPNAGEVLDHGADWVKLDLVLQAASVLGKAGYVAAKFTKDLLVKSKASGIPAKDLVNRVAIGTKDMIKNQASVEEVQQEAFNILSKIEANPELAAQRLTGAKKELTKAEEAANKAIQEKTVTPKDLKDRKITNQTIEKLENESSLLSEPYEPGKTDFRAEVKALEDGGMTAKLDAQSARAATKEELGTTIKDDINLQRRTEKAAYKPFYELAEKHAETVTHYADSTAKTAFDKLLKIGSHKTNPEGYSAVIKTLKGIIKDAGYDIKKTAKGQQFLQKSKEPVNLKHTMDLAKRIHKVIKYDKVDYQIADELREVVQASKRDVRSGLQGNKEAFDAFEKAEAEHARVAKKYGEKAVQKVRKTEAGEAIAKSINEPTVLENLKNTMSKKEYAKVEREILENIREKDYLQAEKQLREVNKHLSKENQALAKEIVEAKNPHNPVARKKAVQEAILTDVSKALTEGSRPQKTLSLWQTPKGQRAVRETFKNSPDGPKIINYLEQQSLKDMTKSVVENGTMNFRKLDQFLKDPAMVNNILDVSGQEGLNFLVKLETRVGQLRENAKLLEYLPTSPDLAKKGQNTLEIAVEKAMQNTKEYRRGQKILEKASEKTKEYKAGQEVLKPNQTPRQKADYKEAEIGKLKRGQAILKRMAQKDFPIQTKIKELIAWGKEMLGLNSQTAMTVFGIAKVGSVVGALAGVPTPFATYLSYGIMNKLLTSQNARKEFIKLSKKNLDPTALILYLHNFEESLKD